MSEDELKAEAARLLDAFGEWATSGRQWWVAAGVPDPPPELIEAVKLEMLSRRPKSPPGTAQIFYSYRDDK